MATPLLLNACNATTTSTSGAVVTAPTPAVLAATSTTIAAAAAGGADPSGMTGPFPTTITGGDGFQANPVNDASFATLINTVRADAGVSALTYNAQLDAAAQAHSNDMLAHDYFAHEDRNGQTSGDRATAAGYKWTAIGENLAMGQSNENLAMNGWISSPGHHANNVNGAFKEFGLGRAGSGSDTRWTLMFGSQ